MARLVWSINVTLDGCADHSQAVVDDEHHDYALSLVRGAAALLLGRKTFELFESHWPHVAKSGAGSGRVVALARELSSKTRYVVSRQRTTSNWAGSVFLSGDLRQEMRALKQRLRGDLVLFGSPGLSRALAELGEIDEFHFLIQPLVAGHGPRLFDGMANKLELTHLHTTVFTSGVQWVRYARTDG